MNDMTWGGGTASGWTTEETPCPLCRSGDAELTPYNQPPFRIRRCTDCRLWYLSPRLVPGDMEAFYRSPDYFSGGGTTSGYSDYSAQERSLRTTFATLLMALKIRGATGGSLLEVGSGPGYLLDEARTYFDARAGVELSETTAREAEEMTGVRVFLAVKDVPDEPAFDTILATHVIEHIYDPVDFVKSLTRRLKPGGHLVLAAPHMGSALRTVMGRRWPSFKYPEHVSYFDAATLSELMTRGGLSEPERVPYPHAFPLSLILSKFGVVGPGWTQRVDVTLPATTVCCLAKKRICP